MHGLKKGTGTMSASDARIGKTPGIAKVIALRLEECKDVGEALQALPERNAARAKDAFLFCGLKKQLDAGSA